MQSITLLFVVATVLFCGIPSLNAIHFKKDKCVDLTASFTFEVAFFDRRGSNVVARYQIPATANVVASCVDKTFSQKKANISISWEQDILDLAFTAPALTGSKISLRSVNYRYFSDNQRFRGIPTQENKAVHREYDEGVQQVAEWKKKFTCDQLDLSLGGGVKLTIRGLSLALFNTDASLKEYACPKSGTTPRPG